MVEDRGALILEAANMAEFAISKYVDDKNMFRSYCDVGWAYLRITGKWKIFDEAMLQIRRLEDRIPDPDITRIVSRFEAIASRYSQMKMAATG